MLRGPRPDGLGSLSAFYESGKRGTSAVGWDEGGGTSYGKYQYAYKVGGLKAFLLWLTVPFPDLYSALWPLYGSAGEHPSKKSTFMMKWLELAQGPDLPLAEHEHIATKYYDVAYSGMDTGPREMVEKFRALQDVLWSTAVQHGPGSPGGSKGAIGIFNGAFREGISAEDYIDAIYAKRGTFLGKLKQSTRASVLDRYSSEKKKAKAMLPGQGNAAEEARLTGLAQAGAELREGRVGPGPLDQVRADIQNGGKKT